MTTMLGRLYCDYLMPSQLAAYEEVVHRAQEACYEQLSVRDYVERVRDGACVPGKFLVHRHDIDTDLRTTRKLFDIEKKHGIRSSFYFRLSTLDFGLMRDIEEYGSEASYHYEELAAFAKKYRIKDPATLRARMPEIRANFLANFLYIEERLKKKLRTVASHGDFVNRRLKITNTEILDDPQLRKECGIACETYDRALLDHIDIYISDRPAPQYYHPTSPTQAIREHRRICLVTHPRQVETNWAENTKDNIFRFYEGLIW
ncbi:hypothetical protein [Massilia sp. H6]|uniref:hypothetical protein n=1 Tax=Massilia sp. H6 TaxID=2970464 RepID=UPI0021688DB2|nr:hypothetical protein [Massilia sp. H6]UVW30306.1 hypothetical protein NRS07_09355 [Massilia sp. H6]